MADLVLALNAGSSTLKYALYRMAAGLEERLAAATLPLTAATPTDVLELVLQEAAKRGVGPPTSIGHRVVHGGSTFTAPVRVDPSVLENLESLVSLAPLHLPPAIALMRQALTRCPAALHVACFDTAFHATLPEVARRFALPTPLYERGVRRYGFHGLSYEYVLSALGSPLPERLIVAHLGSGASLCAILGGRSIDTSMGLTPTGGVPMGSRSGDLDPGVVLYLQRELRYSPSQVEELLNHASGLHGLAGTSDMSELLARTTAGDAIARAAVELFSYAVKKQIGAYVAALGGLDCLVFTGGIGEHAPLVRELATRGLEPFGVQLDPVRNAQNASTLNPSSSPCQVRIVPTDEDLVIARGAHRLAQDVQA
jgi:acetate kinase